MPVKLVCKIFRSPRHEGMYLYVASGEGLERVPESLLQRFGRPVEAMTLLLTPGRPLARCEPEEVIRQIQQQGFFLQLPPLPGSDMRELAERNDKLPR